MSTVALACPDKFRGTLTAPRAAAAMAQGLRTAGFEEVRELPLADGGEGTLAVLLAACGGSRRVERVTGPLGDPVDAAWGLLADGTAVVEAAEASGLQRADGRNDALAATSRGTGELIATAARLGARRIVVGVGGTATTDGGLGALEALRWSLAGLDVTVACDVRTGFVDAAATFGPQKGASSAQVAFLTRRLEQLADRLAARTGVEVRELEGAGAAGGLAGGLASLGATLEPGFEAVARVVGLDAAMQGADLVVTGEGKLDASTFEGKTVAGVLEWAAEEGVPCLAVIAGQAAPTARDELSVRGPAQLLVLTDRVWHAGEAFSRAATLVEEAAIEAGRAVLDRG